jgi:hypothetical protein
MRPSERRDVLHHLQDTKMPVKGSMGMQPTADDLRALMLIASTPMNVPTFTVSRLIAMGLVERREGQLSVTENGKKLLHRGSDSA